MDLLHITRMDSVMDLWRPLLVCGALVTMFSCKVDGYCEDILIANGGMPAVQVFLPRKIEMHKKCTELRENRTDVCSNECNSEVKRFLQSNGGGDDTSFLTCECSESSNVYPLSECDIDRTFLLSCPFLIELQGSLTTVPAEENTVNESNSNSVVSTDVPTITTQSPGKDCRRARLDCSQTIGCAQAFDYVKDMCLDGFNLDGKCSSNCKGALDRLAKYRSSKYIWGCQCDPKSEEKTWCHMFRHRDGLRTACESVVYQPKVDAKPSTAVTSDPGGSGNRHASVTFIISVIIPLCTLLGLSS